MVNDKFTYGVEIEWSDIDRRIEIPKHLGVWDKEDATLVNSDGTANDPTLKKTFLGGEINTRPTDTIEEQGEIVRELVELLNPVNLYRGNLHVHVGVAGLRDDLDSLKRVFQYARDNEEFVYFEMLPRVAPTSDDFPDKDDLKLALSFNRQQNYWAKQRVPANRAEDILNSTDPKNFYDCFFQYNEKLGRRLYHIGICRAGVNIRAVFKYDTIEFRVFPGTTSPEEVMDALRFADEFVRAALFNPTRTAREIYKSRTWQFPQWQPFRPELERGFLATKHKYMDYPDPNESYRRKKEEKKKAMEAAGTPVKEHKPKTPKVEKEPERTKVTMTPSNYDTFTYGLELEWTDCDASTKLPDNTGHWSHKEWTLVNSDGRANDPTLVRNNQGGEINTIPTNSIDEQIKIVQTLHDLLNPTAVYRANLHVHVGVAGLANDIDGLNRLFKYTVDNQEYVFHRVLAREPEVRSNYSSIEDFRLATKFERQQTLWAKQGVPPHRAVEVLRATTPKEFYDAHFYRNEKTGKYVYHIGIFRAGINVRALFNHDTIEFRCFPGTTDPEEIRNALEFAREFIWAGLNDHTRTAEVIYNSREWNLPKWAKFDPELERGFQATKKRPDNI
jgi:hypothetical protein